MLSDFFKVLLFSIIMCAAMPLLLLPYGIFIIPWAYFISFYFFFLPVLILSSLMKYSFPNLEITKKYSTFGIIAGVGIFIWSARTIATERGTGEYFGNHPFTYVQLSISLVAGIWVWRKLSKAILHP